MGGSPRGADAVRAQNPHTNPRKITLHPFPYALGGGAGGGMGAAHELTIIPKTEDTKHREQYFLGTLEPQCIVVHGHAIDDAVDTIVTANNLQYCSYPLVLTRHFQCYVIAYHIFLSICCCVRSQDIFSNITYQ